MIVSLVSKKWCDLYGLIVKPRSGVTITLALGKVLNIVGTASIMVMLAPILKVDLRDIAVSSRYFYQFMIEIEIMSRLQGVMGPIETRLLGTGVKGHFLGVILCGLHKFG